MDELKCPYCFSTHVDIIDSYETRDVAVVQCYTCGRVAEIDTENAATQLNTNPHVRHARISSS